MIPDDAPPMNLGVPAPPVDLPVPDPETPAGDAEPVLPPANQMPEGGFPSMPSSPSEGADPDLGTLASVSRVLDAAAGTAATVVGGAIAGAAAGAAAATRRVLRDRDGDAREKGEDAKREEADDKPAAGEAGSEAPRAE